MRTGALCSPAVGSSHFRQEVLTCVVHFTPRCLLLFVDKWVGLLSCFPSWKVHFYHKQKVYKIFICSLCYCHLNSFVNPSVRSVNPLKCMWGQRASGSKDTASNPFSCLIARVKT